MVHRWRTTERTGDGAGGVSGPASFERGQPLADVDGGAQLAIDAVDARVDPADLGDELTAYVTHLDRQAVDLVAQASVDVVDLLVDTLDVGPNSLHLATNLVERWRDQPRHRSVNAAHRIHSTTYDRRLRKLLLRAHARARARR